MNANAKLALKIKDISLLSGNFTLRSGATSSLYFDRYKFESDPKTLSRVAESMALLLPNETEVIAGLEMGGIPIVTALSRFTGLPAAFIRKEAKPYGTCIYAEGADLKNRKVVLVEDVVSYE